MKASLQDFITKIFTTLKNNLKTVAFTGNYSDLSNRPTIPTVGNGTVTIKQAGASKGTFTMNQSGNTTIELTDNNTTYSAMKGATSSTAGSAGLVPAPASGKQASFLRGDGTWVVPTDTNTWRGIQNNLTSDSTTDSLSAAQGKALKGLVDGKAAASHTHNYLASSNPTGTGSFSLNRKAGSTVGTKSFAEGNNTTASGNYSHAEGNNTTASGNYSHAEGNATKASSNCSHAEGDQTTASEECSHAEGAYTIASGFGSHAEGNSATASGYCSHAEGQGTTANGQYQHVQGRYNVADTTSAFIIGNGTDSTKSNAMKVDWSGNLEVAGDLKDGSGNVLSNMNDSLDQLNSNLMHYVDTQVQTGNFGEFDILNLDITSHRVVNILSFENNVVILPYTINNKIRGKAFDITSMKPTDCSNTTMNIRVFYYDV